MNRKLVSVSLVLDELRMLLAGVKPVGTFNELDVILRRSVLELVDRRRAEHSQAEPITMDLVHEAAQRLIELANLAGLVVTIERQPLQPLAMGHAEYVIETRPARGGQ